ncbi:MAG TPA: hypothetical protein VLY04_02340 [Bryobacteraceae bacterium]|nr:hypothetical protein [Bryobacteraceae bacterium]
MNSMPTVAGSLRLTFSVFAGLWLTGQAYAQYSDNLRDIAATRAMVNLVPGEHKPTPIGDLGHLNVVADLRGFVPMSFYSLASMGLNESGGADKASISNAVQNEISAGLLPGDSLRWYKIPTKRALLMLYSGDLSLRQIAEDSSAQEASRFGNTRFLKESEVTGETAWWCRFAYKIAQGAASLFEKIAGDGFENAEPTTVFLTDQSAFVMMNFRYRSLLRRNSTGQVIVALEFSRALKEYKTFYQVYSTTLVSRSSAEAFQATAPIVAKLLLEYLKG